jgi:hypothetical protein
LQSGFSDRSPARLEITARNTSETTFTAMGGPAHVLPFVDDDYASVDPTGEPVLFLAPDDSSPTVDPEDEQPSRLRPLGDAGPCSSTGRRPGAGSPPRAPRSG